METLANLDFYERFQTAIVGVLGFAGVIIALISNARLVRRDRLEALRQERAALRTALVEELKILKLSLEDGIQKLEEQDDRSGAIVPTDPMSDVYNAFVPRIGILTSQEVKKVMWAYLSVREFRKNLVLLPGTTVVDQHRVAVLGQSFAPFLEMQRNLLPLLDDAIRSLSPGETTACTQ